MGGLGFSGYKPLADLQGCTSKHCGKAQTRTDSLIHGNPRD